MSVTFLLTVYVIVVLVRKNNKKYTGLMTSTTYSGFGTETTVAVDPDIWVKFKIISFWIDISRGVCK